jgi:hypothetical protein
VTYWDGTRGALHYILSSDGTALSDLLLLDISTLTPAPTAVKIRTISITMWGNFILTFEWDATTDTTIEIFETQTADVSQTFISDYTDFPGGMRVVLADKTAAGFTGDVLATSSGLAASDGFSLYMTFEKD